METGESIGVHLLDKHVHLAKKHAIINVLIACLGPLIYFLTQLERGSLSFGGILLLPHEGFFFLLLLLVCCFQTFKVRRVIRYRDLAMLTPSISWRLDADEWTK